MSIPQSESIEIPQSRRSASRFAALPLVFDGRKMIAARLARGIRSRMFLLMKSHFGNLHESGIRAQVHGSESVIARSRTRLGLRAMFRPGEHLGAIELQETDENEHRARSVECDPSPMQ
jgi:hypothetical protein